MAYVHVAHDVSIGDHVILANGAALAGHVTVGDWVDISPYTGVHQFCRIGRHAFIGPYSVVIQDVMPYSTTVGEREIRVFGANRVGLERRGFSKEVIESLQTALRLLTRSNLNTTQAVERIRAEMHSCAEVEELLEFIRSSPRGVIK
jgi:UDP-N-acetylglucosamine acyltransferase